MADLAASRVAARSLSQGWRLEPVGLRSGEGLSVRQILAAVVRITGVNVDPEISRAVQEAPSRIGRLRRALRMGPQLADKRSVDQMVSSAW